MKLRVKPLNIIADRPIAVLHKDMAEQLQVQQGSRLKIRRFYRDEGKKNGWTDAIIDIATAILKRNEIALTHDIVKKLDLKENEFVEIIVQLRPHSIHYITKKLHGDRLNFTEMYSVISDIAKGALTEAEIAYFISAVSFHGLDFDEMTSLTKAMIKTGNVLKNSYKYVLDLHSPGGVAGNRTSPIVVALVASAIDHLKLDAVVVKTASRAITSAAGTTDVMETVCRVEFSSQEIKNILKKTRACLVWNSALKLAPADDRIVKIESLVSLDANPQMISSVMSKKIADGATHVLIDIPCGKSAKFSFKEGYKIKRGFLKMGRKFNLKMDAIITNGSQPIGRGIGPVLEMLDILSVLKNYKNRPLDLEEKALMLASKILALTHEISEKEALSMCKVLLYSGRAYEKFRDIILAQGGKPNFEDNLKVARFHWDVNSKKRGKIIAIDNKKIALIAKMAGSPGDKGAGISLHKKVGEKIYAEETLFTIYSENHDKLEYAEKIAHKMEPIEIK